MSIISSFLLFPRSERPARQKAPGRGAGKRQSRPRRGRSGLPEEFLKTVRYWLELGVSGFRVDAVPFLIPEEGINVDDPKPAYGMLRHLRELVHWRKGDAVLLAEANIAPEEARDYFGEHGERLRMIFNFPVNQPVFYALASADTGPLREKPRREGCTRPRSGPTSRTLTTSSISAACPRNRSRAVFDAFGPTWRQRMEQDSLLNRTERVIRLRKELPEIGRGEFTVF